MKDSPFIYGTTVSEYSFTNRELEMEKLKSNLLNGINTMIISPRRWGKSSLVEKVIKNINKSEKKTKTVIIDLFTASNEEEFLENFAREIIKASSAKWQEWMSSGQAFFKKIIPNKSFEVAEGFCDENGKINTALPLMNWKKNLQNCLECRQPSSALPEP